jgi:hypothetical protein
MFEHEWFPPHTSRNPVPNPKNVLGPSHQVEDEHHDQDDDQKTDQSVAGSSDGKHVVLLVSDAKVAAPRFP